MTLEELGMEAVNIRGFEWCHGKESFTDFINGRNIIKPVLDNKRKWWEETTYRIRIRREENNVKSESESQSETSSETGKKSSPFEDRCKFSIEEEALNALYVGKDYNDSCGMVREEVGRQIGEIEILGCGLMKTLVKESENQFELHGEDNIEKNPGEVQEATDIVIGLKRADVVSKGLEDTTFIMSGSKDAGLNLGPIFVSSRALEDVCNMGIDEMRIVMWNE
ncbi:hypothetical protein V6N12_029832 [Hibiscus sabdariffa]|uniref:Uncharacterized protein n=1 Tax=Hibiscus sabdariffa TaxID=183260 RepID=A0ABR2CXT1_9ROSI